MGRDSISKWFIRSRMGLCVMDWKSHRKERCLYIIKESIQSGVGLCRSGEGIPEKGEVPLFQMVYKIWGLLYVRSCAYVMRLRDGGRYFIVKGSTGTRRV